MSSEKTAGPCLLEAAGLAPYQLLAYPAIIMVGAADAAAVVADASAGALFVLIAFIDGNRWATTDLVTGSYRTEVRPFWRGESERTDKP